MVQYERLWRVVGETDLIQLVFCHPADAGVVVGGPVVMLLWHRFSSHDLRCECTRINTAKNNTRARR